MAREQFTVGQHVWVRRWETNRHHVEQWGASVVTEVGRRCIYSLGNRRVDDATYVSAQPLKDGEPVGSPYDYHIAINKVVSDAYYQATVLPRIQQEVERRTVDEEKSLAYRQIRAINYARDIANAWRDDPNKAAEILLGIMR